MPGRIEITATETTSYVTFAVTDNGRGIDSRDKGRVFELFRRSGPQDRPGEGIGLAHVRTLVRRLGLCDAGFGTGEGHHLQDHGAQEAVVHQQGDE